MVVKCVVLFDQNSHGVFYSGQVMSGSVQLTLDKPKKFKGISLKFGGHAKCHWTQSEYRPVHRHTNDGNRTTMRHQTVHYHGHEQYLGTSAMLVEPSNGIRVLIDGAAMTHWIDVPNAEPQGNIAIMETANQQRSTTTQNQQTHYHHNRFKITHYKASELYLSIRLYLERSSDGSDILLQTGLHTYAFQCFLPAQLPTSFEGKYGSIRYTIKVVMERPWKFDISHKIAFTVLKMLDLNYDTPILRMPCQMEMTKSFCCWPCSSGPLSLTASVPQTGYVPGESIIIQAQVVNLSSTDVDYMRFELRQMIVYHSQTPSHNTKEKRRSIVVKRSAGAKPNNEERYEISLPIPSLPPTSVNGCRIIFISYDIRIEAEVSMNNNPSVEIPIIIGNVPLQPVRHAYDNVGMVRDESAAHLQTRAIEQPTAPDTDSVTHVPWPNQSYADLPPPSYEECIAESKEPGDDDDTPFTPRYPVYNLQTKVQASTSSADKARHS